MMLETLSSEYKLSSTHVISPFVGRRQPNLGNTKFRELWNLVFKMLPPAHVRVRTIPSEELDLRELRKRTSSKFDNFTMRAFPEWLSGPSDIRVRAPGRGFEGIFNVLTKSCQWCVLLANPQSAGIQTPPAVAVMVV